jgi:uncharacterized protein (TIGR04255 family)
MANLKNAPLIYTLGMINFPRVPNIERFTDKFLDLIRSEYPLGDDISMPVFSANVGPEGIHVGQQETKIWQFASVDRAWGFVLTDQALCLHTSCYHDFADFSSRYEFGIKALLNIPEIGIKWISAVGIRYVDLVVSQPDEELSKYLQSWVLPVEPPSSPLEILDGAYIARYKTNLGEFRLQALRCPQFTLPPELQSPLTVKNGWVKNRPDTDFALIDTDHSLAFNPPVNINADDALTTLSKLHDVSKAIFNSIGTSFAKNLWEGS